MNQTKEYMFIKHVTLEDLTEYIAEEEYFSKFGRRANYMNIELPQWFYGCECDECGGVIAHWVKKYKLPYHSESFRGKDIFYFKYDKANLRELIFCSRHCVEVMIQRVSRNQPSRSAGLLALLQLWEEQYLNQQSS